MRSIKVLIVDDSAVVRSTLTRGLCQEFQIVGGAKDPYEARMLIIAFRPDVILLDIEMPRMGGLTFLKKLQAHYPVPVIMVSGTSRGSNQAALMAIEIGAVDFVAKPASGGAEALHRLFEELSDKIRAAVIARPVVASIPLSADGAAGSFRDAGLDARRYLVVIGASTGGTEAIKQLLSEVPDDFPPVAIVQHMPAGFTQAFAERLNQFSAMSVTEAIDGDVLSPGRAFVARGGMQMRVSGKGGRWCIVYGTDELVNRHCPSVDVLFDSAAQHAGNRSVGIILTGMGADGARGLLKMQDRGALTLAQDQKSCVVYGMPKVAVELGAVQHIAAPAEIPGTLMQALRHRDANMEGREGTSRTRTEASAR